MYKRLYPTSSTPGSFYGIAKVHKLKEREGVDKLTLTPIISNIGTATYEIARYLAELFPPLGKSKHTISNTKDFISKLETKRIQKRFKMILLDGKSLFTSGPLEETVDIVLNKIYDEKKIETNIPQNVMKVALYLCTKRSLHLQWKILYSNRLSTNGITVRHTISKYIYDISKGSHVTIH